MRVYDAVLNFLIASGVRLYAGMVGSTSAPYVSSLAERPEGRYVAVRHEQVAAAIADAAGRLTGRPACVLTHGASGALAASLGIAAAGTDATPMLVLSVTQERIAMERGYWQALDVLGPMSGFTKWQARVERPDRALDVVREALIESVSGRPGVSQVDIPIDISTANYDGHAWPGLSCVAPMYRPCAGDAQVAAVLSLLSESSRPVILIGGGAAYSGAGIEILRLAERLCAPVINTPTSRGVVSEASELSFGPSGILGYEPIGRAIKEADLVLAIGSRLSDLQLARADLLPASAPIVQVNLDPGSIGKFHTVEVGIVADARSFAEQLNAALQEQPPLVRPAQREWVAAKAREIRDWTRSWLSSAPANGLVHPQEVVRAMANQLPGDVIFAHGAGNHGYYGYMVPVNNLGAHLVSARLGAMGCALGYGIGAKIVRPEQTVVVCIGDGDLMLQVGDLETMVREGLDIIVVVFNNFRLGSQYERLRLYGPVQGVEHLNPDFAKLAELFGCKGYRVDTPGQFDSVLREALQLNEPVVIDVIIDPESEAPRIRLSEEAR